MMPGQITRAEVSQPVSMGVAGRVPGRVPGRVTVRDLILQSPAALLLITGTLVGFNFPLGKLAADALIPPVVWAALVSCGALLALSPYLLARGRLGLPRPAVWRYALIAGPLSFVAPNLLVFGVIPHVGAGFAGLMFALSPTFTLVMSLLFRFKAPGLKGILGILCALVGAAVVSLTRGSGVDAPDAVWLAAALAIPLALASGNVYRTLAWPEGAPAEVLAFWSHVAAAALFVLLLIIGDHGAGVLRLREVPILAIAQMAVAGLTFPFLFRLQRVGGPVVLSQLGYVSAAVSLLAANLFLGERYAPLTWGGAIIIGVGLMLSMRRSERPSPAGGRGRRLRRRCARPDRRGRPASRS